MKDGFFSFSGRFTDIWCNMGPLTYEFFDRRTFIKEQLLVDVCPLTFASSRYASVFLGVGSSLALSKQALNEITFLVSLSRSSGGVDPQPIRDSEPCDSS